MKKLSYTYYITCVCYDKKTHRISKVKRHAAMGNQLEKGSVISAAQVISELTTMYENIVYFTCYEDELGGFEIGAQVNVVDASGTPYIRTDRNEIEADNLGDLPECEKCL